MFRVWGPGAASALRLRRGGTRVPSRGHLSQSLVDRLRWDAEAHSGHSHTLVLPLVFPGSRWLLDPEPFSAVSSASRSKRAMRGHRAAALLAQGSPGAHPSLLWGRRRALGVPTHLVVGSPWGGCGDCLCHRQAPGHCPSPVSDHRPSPVSDHGPSPVSDHGPSPVSDHRPLTCVRPRTLTCVRPPITHLCQTTDPSPVSDHGPSPVSDHR